jgi:lysophospholipase L1-like esterase
MLAEPSTTRHLLHSLVLVLALFFVTLILAEVVLRVSGRVSTESVRVASDPTYGQIPGVFEPNQDVTERPRQELTHHVSINSLGFRGPELSIDKASDGLRILCLGDSFTFGSFVNDEDTFPYLLLGKLSHESKHIEVVNGGVGGSTIIDQVHFLRKAMAIKPDIVLLTFSENDIDDLNKIVPIHVSMESNRRLKSGMAGQVYRFLRNTAVFNFVLLANAWYSDLMTPRAVENNSVLFNNEADHLWNMYEAELRAMAKYLQDRSIQFVFAIFPSDHRIGKPLSLENRLVRVHKLADHIGIGAIDLLKPLQQSHLASTELYLLPYDGHPSRLAYEIVAESIATYLRSRHLIKQL